MFVATESSSTTTTTCSVIQWSPLGRHFEFGEILSATHNFDESLLIGHGGFGKVYKGNIDNGSALVVAAIKRLDAMSNQGESEFWAEVEMLSKLRHCHLVSLIGYCNHEREMILVYEYMPLGTLADHLHKLGTPLSWCQRLKICIGAARGLDYLHTGTGTEYGIIHRDVKSSNILLNNSWEAKVSDFGLSKISPRNQLSTHVSTLVKGTFGYFDPNYFATGKLTRKSDVYAFGVVLLEVLCRKRAVEDSLEWGIATWAQDFIKEGRLKDIVDYDIRREISSKCLKQFARIAEKCLDNHPKHRPTMAEVVLRLEYVLTLHEKTNNMSSKTIFGRMADKFSFAGHGQSPGMEIGFLMPKNNISIDFGFLMPRKEVEQPPVSVYENSDSSNLCHRFTFAQIKAATNNFDEARVLGVGKCGKVYLGVTDGGKTKVAIKRQNKGSDLALQDFRTELEMLSKLSHPHLISLIGYCDEKDEMILVFDYLAHGSLRDHLYKTKSEPLAWTRRLEICIGVARGLHYLHAGGRDTIIHRDVKTTNILLDDKWVAKLSDFGLSKTTTDHAPVSTCARGTLEYIDPEYVRRSRLTEKSDVYSFGVVLCEILSAQPITGLKIEDRHVSLAEWALDCHKMGVLDQILDPYLKGKISAESFMKVAETAVKCLADCGIDRPSMVDVLLDLEYALALHERPLKGTSKDFDENLIASTSNGSISSLKKSFDENLMASTSNASISSLSSLSSEGSDGSDTSVV